MRAARERMRRNQNETLAGHGNSGGFAGGGRRGGLFVAA